MLLVRLKFCAVESCGAGTISGLPLIPLLPMLCLLPMQTFLGKAVVLGMICLGVVLIPVQAAQVYAELSARRVVLGESIN